jgi:hypothetical protein
MWQTPSPPHLDSITSHYIPKKLASPIIYWLDTYHSPITSCNILWNGETGKNYIIKIAKKHG